MDFYPQSDQDKKRYKWIRIISGAVLLVATVAAGCFWVPQTLKQFLNPTASLEIPSAMLAYSLVMVQFAFFFLRKYRTRNAVKIRFIVLCSGWFLATLTLWGLVVIELPAWADRPGFLVSVIGFITTCANLFIEGKPPAQQQPVQSIAWLWKPAPWETPATPNSSVLSSP